jgi:DNA-binding NarL/FixJ family response regulator
VTPPCERPRGRVLLAEAEEASKAAIRDVLAAGGFAVVAEAADAQAALAAARATTPGFALLATELPGDALLAARSIAAAHPATRIVMLSARPNGDELLAAVRAGAVGYLEKSMGMDRLAHALQGILMGEVVLPRQHTARLVKELRDRDRRRTAVAERVGVALTEREWEVSELLATERTTGEMATQLGISAVTVRRHVSSLLSKLSVTDRAGAAALLRQRMPAPRLEPSA